MFFCIALLLVGYWSCLGATVTFTIEPCPPGWTEYEGFCYRYFSQTKSWTDAQSFCRNVSSNGYSTGTKYQRSDLTSIHSSAENDFIYNYWLSCRDSGTPDSNNLYIGLNDPQHNRVWKWSDGSTVDYLNWGRGEPNNINNLGEYYVSMHDAKIWYDQHEASHKEFPFICKMPRDNSCRNN